MTSENITLNKKEEIILEGDVDNIVDFAIKFKARRIFIYEGTVIVGLDIPREMDKEMTSDDRMKYKVYFQYIVNNVSSYDYDTDIEAFLVKQYTTDCTEDEYRKLYLKHIKETASLVINEVLKKLQTIKYTKITNSLNSNNPEILIDWHKK